MPDIGRGEMTVYIFTEAGRQAGYGHAARCYALYQSLTEEGASVKMYVAGADDEAFRISGGKCISAEWRSTDCRIFGDIKSNDVVIIDSYHADLDVYRKLRDLSCMGVYFDDFDRLEYPEGMIINPSVNREGGFFGLKYAVLRKAFWDNKIAEIKETPQKALIALGSGADKAYTEKTAKLIMDTYGYDTVIFGHGPEGAVSGLDDTETAELFRSCDIAVTAGGQTMLELASCGVPSLVIKTVDNQQNNIDILAKSESVLYIGDVRGNSPTDICDAVKELADRGIREKLSENSMEYLDGQGARRIAKAVVRGF